MDRTELTIAITAVLFVFFLAGWLGHLIWARMAAAASPREDRANELAAELLLVEDDRNRIAAEAAKTTSLIASEAEAEQARLETQLREREAELDAAMEALRSARAEAEAQRRG